MGIRPKIRAADGRIASSQLMMAVLVGSPAAIDGETKCDL